jgi:hypothetical protein
MAVIKELGDGGTDGTRLGLTSSELLAFWGATPVNQPSGTNQSAIATAAITPATVTPITGTYGFVTSVAGNAVMSSINDLVVRVEAIRNFTAQLRTDLIEIGIIKGSA